MAQISRKIALHAEELDGLVTSSWNIRIAPVAANDRINLTPMRFGWVNGKIYFTGQMQKIVNLRRNSSTTLLMDKNERFPEMVGAMFQGTTRVLETAEWESADTDLDEAQRLIGANTPEASARLPRHFGETISRQAATRTARWCSRPIIR